MEGVLGTMILAIAALAAFFVLITALKYAISDPFSRTRLIMTAFFCFIVATLTMSFWRYTVDSLPYAVPSLVLGLMAGYVLGVREAQRKMMESGLEWYREHFAHVHLADMRSLTWWSVINFYTVMGALAIINLVGLSNVIFKERESLAMATCAVGAFLLGTIAPYLLHLWSVKTSGSR